MASNLLSSRGPSAWQRRFCNPTLHLLLQGEGAVDLLQLRLHGQPADVGLQMRAVHHADAEHNQRDVLRLAAHQAAPPPAGRLVGRGGLLLLVFIDDFTQRLGGTPATFCRT